MTRLNTKSFTHSAAGHQRPSRPTFGQTATEAVKSHILLSDAAAVPASAEATFSFQKPQQYPLPQKPHSLFRSRSSTRFRRSHILFSEAAAVPASAEATFSFQKPQQYPLPQKPHSVLRCCSSTRFRRSHILF